VMEIGQKSACFEGADSFGIGLMHGVSNIIYF